MEFTRLCLFFYLTIIGTVAAMETKVCMTPNNMEIATLKSQCQAHCNNNEELLYSVCFLGRNPVELRVSISLPELEETLMYNDSSIRVTVSDAEKSTKTIRYHKKLCSQACRKNATVKQLTILLINISIPFDPYNGFVAIVGVTIGIKVHYYGLLLPAESKNVLEKSWVSVYGYILQGLLQLRTTAANYSWGHRKQQFGPHRISRLVALITAPTHLQSQLDHEIMARFNGRLGHKRQKADCQPVWCKMDMLSKNFLTPSDWSELLNKSQYGEKWEIIIGRPRTVESRRYNRHLKLIGLRDLLYDSADQSDLSVNQKTTLGHNISVCYDECCSCDLDAGSVPVALVTTSVVAALLGTVLTVLVLVVLTMRGRLNCSQIETERILVLLPPGCCAMLRLLPRLPNLHRRLRQQFPRHQLTFRGRPKSLAKIRKISNEENRVIFLFPGGTEMEPDYWINQLVLIEHNRFSLMRAPDHAGHACNPDELNNLKFGIEMATLC